MSTQELRDDLCLTDLDKKFLRDVGIAIPDDATPNTNPESAQSEVQPETEGIAWG